MLSHYIQVIVSFTLISTGILVAIYVARIMATGAKAQELEALKLFTGLDCLDGSWSMDFKTKIVGKIHRK